MHLTPNNKVPVPNKNIVGVIGGGIGGLMSACLLAADGCRVTLFEKMNELAEKWMNSVFKATVLTQVLVY